MAKIFHWPKCLIQEWASDLRQSLREISRIFAGTLVRNSISAIKRYKDGGNIYLLLPWEKIFQKIAHTQRKSKRESENHPLSVWNQIYLKLWTFGLYKTVDFSLV